MIHDRYKSLSKTNKGIFWTIITALITILVSVVFFILSLLFPTGDINNINVNNSSLTNSPLIQSSSNFSLIYTLGDSYDNLPFGYYTKPIQIKTDYYEIIRMEKQGCMVSNVFFDSVIVLPSRQKVFLNAIWYNESYTIAYFNNDETDAYIPHAYRVPENITDKDICYTFYIDKVGEPMRLEEGEKVNINKSSCFKNYGGECFLRSNHNNSYP